MPIVNHTNYPYLYSTEEVTKIEYRNNSGGYWAARNWHDGYNYWYCSVFYEKNTDEIDFLKLIPDNIINDESTFIVLCTEFEAFTNIVETIYKNIIQKLNINPKKIILISENADIVDVVKEVASSYNLSTINVEWSVAHEVSLKKSGASIYDKFLPDTLLSQIHNSTVLEKKSYKKSFLNFNRRWRIHRPCFVGLLYSMKLLDKGFVSLGASDDNLNWNNTFDTILKLIAEDSDMSSLLLENKENLINLPNLYLDTTDLVTDRLSITYENINHLDTIRLYEDSYFSIVSETYFFKTIGRTFTEKTFKPILYKHPFILMSNPNSLTLLKKLGYKTFHPFIDESYDNETNNVKRLRMILNEVNRLSNLTESELFEFIDKVKEITIHNHNNLVNKPKFMHVHRIL